MDRNLEIAATSVAGGILALVPNHCDRLQGSGTCEITSLGSNHADGAPLVRDAGASGSELIPPRRFGHFGLRPGLGLGPGRRRTAAGRLVAG